MSTPENISVILTTYNSPLWLEKVVVGFKHQTILPNELIIADDGSTSETKELIAKLQQDSPFPIIHVWHEDDGFRKTLILNKAIKASKYEYLLITDGDCIPRADFLEVHKANAEEGLFISGGYLKLPQETSEAITNADIANGNVFNPTWLKANGMSKSLKNLKLTNKEWLKKLLNKITPTKATWNGHNSSTWRKDIIAVGGFNEGMQYGGLDRELGERLFNAGLKSKQLRYSAIVVHLHHGRGYVTDEMRAESRAIWDRAINEKLTKIPSSVFDETDN